MKASTLVKRALRALGVVAEANEPSADMMTDGLSALGGMLAGWELRGVHLGAHYPLVADTDVPLAAREIECAVWSLAASLALEYGREPGRFLPVAERAFRGMQAERNQPRAVRASEWAFHHRRWTDNLFGFGGGGGGIVLPPGPGPGPDPEPPVPGIVPFPIAADMFGLNVERNFNIANQSGDGIPSAVVSRMSLGGAGARWIRCFVFFTPELGHGTRTAPVWPANPLGNVNFQRLVNTIDRYVAAGMPVIYAFIPGPYGLDQFTQDPTQLNRAAYLAYLSAGAAWFAARYTPAQFVLQPWNETFSGDAGTVNGLIADTYAALRAGAPNHWIAFSGPDFAKVWRVADMQFPLGAERVAVDIHDYEVIDGGDGTYFGRTSFIPGQRTRLACPIIFGEIDPARALFTTNGFDLDDPRRITTTKTFLAAVGCAGGLWAWCEGARRVNDPITPLNTDWWPQLENALVPGTHTISVNAPTGGTFTLPHLLTISGTYTGRPTFIEARVGGSSWAALDTEPNSGAFTGAFPVATAGPALAVEVRFANGRSITAATTVSITAATVEETISVTGTGGFGGASYSGTFTPTSPAPTIFVYAVQLGVDVQGEPADTIGVGTFSGSMSGLSPGTTTFRAEMLSGTEVFSETFTVEVDNVAPTIESITPPEARNYKTGDLIDGFVRMTEPITVIEGSETPYIEAGIGVELRKMTFLSGPTAQDLTFRYEVTGADSDNDGISIAGSVTLAGGSFRDAAGNNADFSGLAWGGNPALIRVNQPDVTVAALPAVAGVGLPLAVTGTVFPDNEPVEVVWRQGGVDVGSPVAATEIGRAWTATINAPAVTGTYTLRARHVGNGAILANSGNVVVSAAGVTAIPYNLGLLDVRADEPGSITTVDAGVSLWTSGQSITGTLVNSTAANQPQHSSVNQAVSYSGASAGDGNGDFHACVAVRDRYRNNATPLGVFYMLLRRTATPTWEWTIARVGANTGTYNQEFARSYALRHLTNGSFRVLRQGNTSGTFLSSDISGWNGAGWIALGWVLNDSRASGVPNGTAESISRLFVKTKGGGSFDVMANTATSGGTIITNDASMVCDIGRSRWNNFNGAAGQVAALEIHSAGFDANPPITNGGIELALDQLLARV